MRKLQVMIGVALFALCASSHAGFVETLADGTWTDASIWNWRNGSVAPAEGYPNTTDTAIIEYVTVSKDVFLIRLYRFLDCT